MSLGATLSVLGLYNEDNSLFDLMQFPEDFTTAQKKTVTDNILIECAELEFLYPNPTVAKNIIGIWSYKEVPYWDRVYKASQLEYNAIENYRRTETETIEDDREEQHSGSDTSTDSGTESLAKTGTDTNRAGGTDSTTINNTGSEEASGDDRTDNNITGFDNNTLVPNSETEIYYGKTMETSEEGTQTNTYGRTDTVTHNTTDTQTFGKVNTLQHGEKIVHDGTTERTSLMFGNIGVTTSQEMLTQEIEIAKIINVIPVIIQSFINRFCIQVF